MTEVLLTLVVVAAIVLGVVWWVRSSSTSRDSVAEVEAEVSEITRDVQEELDIKLKTARDDSAELKKIMEIKDSGSAIPGHGGFLDRFDGLLLSTPFIAAFLKLF